MRISIKTPEDIAKMRVAGRLTAQVLEMIEPHVQPGVTTDHLNTLCHDYIVKELEAIPAPLNYNGFPKSICTSINHVVCHGIPSQKTLKKGDILNIDVSLIKNGFHGDSSKMFFVGKKPTILAKRLVRIAQECLYIGIEHTKPGATFGDIGAAIQKHAESHGYSIVRDFCGHGIGRAFHEPPQVLHFGKPGTGATLKPGMTFTIEPMVNAGKLEVKILDDRWTVVTRDHSLSAQWEHTLLVTDTGVEVLTQRSEESF